MQLYILLRTEGEITTEAKNAATSSITNLKKTSQVELFK